MIASRSISAHSRSSAAGLFACFVFMFLRHLRDLWINSVSPGPNRVAAQNRYTYVRNSTNSTKFHMRGIPPRIPPVIGAIALRRPLHCYLPISSQPAKIFSGWLGAGTALLDTFLIPQSPSAALSALCASAVKRTSVAGLAALCASVPSCRSLPAAAGALLRHRSRSFQHCASSSLTFHVRSDFGNDATDTMTAP